MAINHSEKLLAMEEWVEENISDVEAFCTYFDITLENLIKSFPDALVINYRKTFLNNDTYHDEDEDELEEEYGSPFTEE